LNGVKRTLLALLKLFKVFEGAHGCWSKDVLVVGAGFDDIAKKRRVWKLLAPNAASEG